ncbi:MAG: ABC transporter ATP-binding protein, partial [Chloroflexi bacterium]|nr:ABC transporter ATP-binding protein [Chloroflexota bacterium]
MTELLLEAHNVTQIYGRGLLRGKGVAAVDGMSFGINADRPSIVALVGESGSGKTTLARLLLGMITPTSGAVVYRGTPLTRLSRRQWREFRREVQAIFQDPFESFNPFHKVDHVLNVPLKTFKLAKSRADARSRIEDALTLVGLRPEETLGHYPHQLSGGQRQRLMVARALLLKPRVILADEPVSMVDASLRATILESILRLKRELGISVLYITHDLTTAYQVSDRMVVLYRGSVVEAGDVGEIVHEPRHPYTRLLVSSIPRPDPKRKWRSDLQGGVLRGSLLAGCKFADRCPVATEICEVGRPPLFRASSSNGV